MDFGREGYCEDDEQQMIHKSGNSSKQFPFSPSSASASSSSPQYKGFFPLSNGRTTTTEAPIYSHQQHHHHGQQQQQQQRGSSSWYETQEESSRSSYDGGSATTPKFELMMEVSPPANHHHHHHQEDAGESQLALGNSATNNIQKEHMFDKVVTPSDVGKLNRLVIPKQHAEKYFPLDSSTNEKGLLLNFEDRTGKPWRFRYSYWNSSQSYVMTKGWSRFVKEKKLDAGDIVSFQRGVGELGKDRLYIDWRRRPNAPDHTTSFPSGLSFPHNFAFHRSIPWSPLFLRPPPANMSSAMHYPQQQQQQQQLPNNINFHHQSQTRNNNYHYNNAMNPCQGSIIYLRSAAAAAGTPQDHEVRMVQIQDGGGGGGGGVDPMVFDSVPVVHGKAAAKKLRLFGVNMECGVSSSSSSSLDESNAASASQSSSHNNIPFTLQSRLYNGIPLQTDFLNKGKSSSMSLDLDI